MKLAFLVPLLVCLASAISHAEDPSLKRLESSPRHHEWVTVKLGDRAVECFVVYPERETKVPAVIVIHENRGLTDWVRGVADQLAEAGYIAIAPDLLSGMAPQGGRTTDFASSDAAMQAIYKLPLDQITADLNAAGDYAAKLPACNGKLSVSGFCWGGGQSFRFATNRKDLAAAFVFYGSPPDDRAAIDRIACPVYGFYGGNDARINATIPRTKELMKAAGKRYEAEIYEGAGHGFMRSGEMPDAAAPNRDARMQAWSRWKELLKSL